MPLNLNELIQQQSQPKTTNASYFDRKFTGCGKSLGLFNAATDIVAENYKTNAFNDQLDIDLGDKHVRQLIYQADPEIESGTKFDFTFDHDLLNLKKWELHQPQALSILNHLNHHDDDFMQSSLNELPHALTDLKFKDLGHFGKFDLELGLLWNSYRYEKGRSTNSGIGDQSYENFAFQPSLIIKAIQNQTQAAQITSINDLKLFNRAGQLDASKNQYILLNQFDLYFLLSGTDYDHQDLDHFLNILNQQLNLNDPTWCDLGLLRDFVNQHQLSHDLALQAQLNHEYLFHDLALLFDFYNSQKNQFQEHQNLIANSYSLIKLENKALTDDDYQKLYQQIKQKTIDNPNLNEPYDQYHFNQLIALNTRLSLNHELDLLKNNHQTAQFKPTVAFQSQAKYSPEQLAVIKTNAPYSVVVAGAGSGKSHTLLGRLSYLQMNQIDFAHVLVTSFTNTAAQNIIDRFHNGINSMTNANLFHTIYQNNFNHVLSDNRSVASMLSIIDDNSKLMRSNQTILDTKNQLQELLKNSESYGYRQVDTQKIIQELVKLMNDHLKDVITILDAIEETSLLLEPIIINAMMQNSKQFQLKFPDNLTNLDFIISDESQDTSTFDYVLLLKLAQLNNAQIMIVGDANQTLYEFRNANPEFLNALERSDIFKTYHMSTNYRSNQSILTFNNELLRVLKTNQTANLQLHANQLDPVDLQTFNQHVQFKNIALPKKGRGDKSKELKDALVSDPKFQNWVMDHYQNQKQIAIMAFKNSDANAISEVVTDILKPILRKPLKMAHTRQPQPQPNTWLSMLCSQTYDDGFVTRIQNHAHITPKDYEHSLTFRLDAVAHIKTDNNNLVNQWALDTILRFTKSAPVQAAINDLNTGKMSYHQFKGRMAYRLLKLENEKNNMAQLMNMKQDPGDEAWQDADVVISSIHSAKGLEFDSTIIYYDENKKNATNQSTLRLYSVALTRAKEDEFILNRCKVKTVNQQPVPTTVGYQDIDMFVTPIRTSLGRVIDDLN